MGSADSSKPQPERQDRLPELGDRPIRIRFFTDRIDWMGPVIVLLSSWYFAAQVVVAWVFRPDYSFVTNTISDLGITSCSPPKSGMCSPLNVVMNISIFILGVAMIVGSILIFSEFSFSEHRRERVAAIAGFASLALGGVGAALVGIFHENDNPAHLHTVGTAMVITFGQLAILILGLTLIEIDNWLREFMLVTSLLVLLAGISYAGKHEFGIGAGALERLAQYPESVWLILFGFYISRDHYRNELIPSGFRFSGERPGKQSTFRSALRESLRGLRIKPAVWAVSATSGPLTGGTSVIITGSGFTGATKVTFGSTPASSFTVTSDRQITATSPAATGAGPVDVTVTTPRGTGSTSAANRYTYT